MDLTPSPYEVTMPHLQDLQPDSGGYRVNNLRRDDQARSRSMQGIANSQLQDLLAGEAEMLGRCFLRSYSYRKDNRSRRAWYGDDNSHVEPSRKSNGYQVREFSFNERCDSSG